MRILSFLLLAALFLSVQVRTTTSFLFNRPNEIRPAHSSSPKNALLSSSALRSFRPRLVDKANLQQQWRQRRKGERLLIVVRFVGERIRHLFQKYTIYVLECENQKYYVGSTTNLRRRVREHWSGRGGSAWTRLHKPIRVVKTYRWVPRSYYLGMEAQVTAQFMQQYGIQNVRGACFSMTRDLSNKDTNALVGFLGHYNNKDYQDVRHQVEEEIRDTSSSTVRRGPTSTDRCYHCGGLGHWKRNCPYRHQRVKSVMRSKQFDDD